MPMEYIPRRKKETEITRASDQENLRKRFYKLLESYKKLSDDFGREHEHWSTHNVELKIYRRYVEETRTLVDDLAIYYGKDLLDVDAVLKRLVGHLDSYDDYRIKMVDVIDKYIRLTLKAYGATEKEIDDAKRQGTSKDILMQHLQVFRDVVYDREERKKLDSRVLLIGEKIDKDSEPLELEESILKNKKFTELTSIDYLFKELSDKLEPWIPK